MSISRFAPPPIDWNALPTSLRILREIIGPVPALALVRSRGGRRIYIPHSIAPTHVVSRILGPQLAERLSKRLGGESLRLPKADWARREQRRAAMRAARERGASLARIAAEHRISRRRVLQILAE